MTFFFLRTLKRPWSGDEMPYPKKRIHLPVIWCQCRNKTPAFLPVLTTATWAGTR